MKTVRSKEIPVGDEWAFEIKWDGVRVVADLSGSEMRLFTRNENEVAFRYPELAGLHEALKGRGAIFDGEIIRNDEDGRPSFQLLQHRIQQTSKRAIEGYSKSEPVTYVIFDVLEIDGESTRDLPYVERRELLNELGLKGTSWDVPRYFEGEGAELFESVRERGIEGIVAKRLESRYIPGRRDGSWLKIKSFNRQEFVVGGWLPGKESFTGTMGALLIGFYETVGGESVLRYCGRVGTGFKIKDRDRLKGILESIAQEGSPFVGKQPPMGACFARPELVVEVAFAEWTDESTLRHPSFQGLRDDKPSIEVVRELALGEKRDEPSQIEGDDDEGLDDIASASGKRELVVDGHRIPVGKLEKVLYPATGFTKGQVIDYYNKIAHLILPYLRDRPVTLKRFPDGVEGEAFYEKNCPSSKPEWVTTHQIKKADGWITACLVQDRATLLWLANLAALELHVPLAVATQMDRPTSIVFDLDPGEGLGLLECCQLGIGIRDSLDGIGLRSFAKTSGQKGLQIYIPLNTPSSYPETKSLARAIADLFKKYHPELVVTRQAKAERKGKILIDWSQNNASKNTIAPYSLRATAEPALSTPVSWEQIKAAANSGQVDGLTLRPAKFLAQLGSWEDPLLPVITMQQHLPEAS